MKATRTALVQFQVDINRGGAQNGFYIFQVSLRGLRVAVLRIADCGVADCGFSDLISFWFLYIINHKSHVVTD